MNTEEASSVIAELNIKDIKDKDRLKCALLIDGTLQIVGPNCNTDQKKTAYVKASKQHYVGMIVGKKGEIFRTSLSYFQLWCKGQ